MPPVSRHRGRYKASLMLFSPTPLPCWSSVSWSQNLDWNTRISVILIILSNMDCIKGCHQWKNIFLKHQNLFITLLLGSKAKTVLAKQSCCIQTKMYRIYRKMTIYGHFFYIIYTFLFRFYKTIDYKEKWKQMVIFIYILYIFFSIQQF